MSNINATRRAAAGLFAIFSFSFIAGAQRPDATTNRSCSTFVLQTAPSLTFQQRSCYLAKRIITPQFFLNGAVFAALDQYRNSPWVAHEHWSRFPERVEIYYARHAGRDGAESFIDYLHHEDPRPRVSNLKGVWRRTNAAAMSVLTSPDEDGHWRPAYGPIAGSFSSAFIGSVMYRHNETLPNTLLHAGGVYGLYFARAICREFKPEMSRMARKLLPSQ